MKKKKTKDTNEGPVVAIILSGYETATTSASGALLILRFGGSRGQPVKVLPVAMTRTQCTELGQALLRLAVHPHRPDKKPN
jgi:hypothetical protein